MSVRKDLIWVLCLFLSISVNVIAGADILSRCRATGLPILHIETVDSVMPSCEVIYPPAGCVGVGITNNEKVGARMWIEENGDTIYDSGIYEDKKSGLTIKVRGNTSASHSGNDAEKKPYKLKLQKKADLLFRNNEGKYADKEWILLRFLICETLSGNIVNKVLGMPWTPSEEVVLLFINGDFRGVYLLTECIKRNQDCRINISKDGLIYEYDAYWWNEDFYISSRFGLNYTLKYPEVEDILPWQGQYLSDYINHIENAYLHKDGIDSLLDISSYARWLWVHDMMGDWDAAGSNPYIYKYDTLHSSRTAMSCAWDFGGCFSPKQDKQWSKQHTFWCFYYFFTLPQTSFVREYINMYDNVVRSAFDVVADKLDSIRITKYAENMNQAQKLDNERWNINTVLPTENMAFLADYFRNRKNDVDDLMIALKADYQWQWSTNTEMITTSKNTAIEYYDLLGRKLSQPTTGIVIMQSLEGRTTKLYVSQKE